MKPASQSPAGELLMLRLAARHWDCSLEQEVRALGPGGILLAGTLPRSPETLHELVATLARCSPALHILALESPGGGADPLGALLPAFPAPRVLAQAGARFAREAGELLGEAMKILGFNAYCGVSLDLASRFTGKSLDERSFSADPLVVVQCAGAFIEGLSRRNILAGAKHFPGRGCVPPAPAGELPVYSGSMAELWRADLIPYRELLPKLPMLVISTAAYKAYDPDDPLPAFLSSQVVDGLLRAKLGYRGVVVAPHFESEQMPRGFDVCLAAIQSLNAGCDMLLVEEHDAWQAMQRCVNDARAAGVLPYERFEASLARIHAATKGWATSRGSFSHKAWERLARRVEEFHSRV